VKPYLVHKTWIDLDHVVAIRDAIHINYPPVMMTAMDWPISATVTVEMMFRGEGLVINLGEVTDADFGKSEPMAVRLVLDAFIAAWKAKDEPQVPFVAVCQKTLTEAMENYHEPKP